MQAAPDLTRWATLDPGAFRFGGAPGLSGILGRRPGIPAPDKWDGWLTAMFPAYFRSFAPHHREFWRWVWSMEPDGDGSFVGVWPRGGGKSTSAEAAVAALGLRGIKTYALYVCATQDAADKRVQNLSSLLESPAVAKHYPQHADRAVNKHGHSRGWRRDRLVTSGGLLVDAAGLETAVRGLKFEERRPDLIVLDDIDGKLDSPATTQKKQDTITHSILPAGATGSTAVIAIQNLITANGIFSRLVDGRADFLANRVVSGPHPALEDMKVERVEGQDGTRRAVIVGGVPTWEGQSRESCQRMVDLYGLSAFIEECQHQVHEREGALWSKALLNATRRTDVPPMVRIAFGVDPSGGGDDIGIVGAGLGADGHVYVFEDRTQPGKKGPLNWGRECVQGYTDWAADRVVGERNYGGDMVENTIKVAAKEMGVPNVSYRDVVATRGKDVRAEPVAALFEDGRAHLCGHFPELEVELTGWVPGSGRSPNRLDAMVWVITELAIKGGRKAQVSNLKYN